MKSANGKVTRRHFLSKSSRAVAGVAAGSLIASCAATRKGASREANLKFGLVTYLWGKDWDLPTLIRHCSQTGVGGVELRVEHAHGVHAGLSARKRMEVRLRFENSPISCVGMGCNWAFHYPDPERLRTEIEGAKADIILSHDIGGSGIKVKPNALPKEVPPEKTIARIGASLNELGKFAAQYGQKVRVEVHGRDTQELPNMKKIFDHVTEPNVGICWNCNPNDLNGEGLEYNFNLVKNRFGDTVHVRELNDPDYPYQQLLDLFVAMGYQGWILLEARGKVADRVIALAEQKALFEKMVAISKAKLAAA